MLEESVRSISKAEAAEMLRLMVETRAFEEQAEESYMMGKIHGTMHLSIGQEGSAVDPRTLRPLDEGPIIASVIKTGRVLIVHEAVKTGGFGGELAAVIAESEAFGYLDAPIARLAGRDMPIPYNRNLEYNAVPQVENIVAKARDIVQGQV